MWVRGGQSLATSYNFASPYREIGLYAKSMFPCCNRIDPLATPISEQGWHQRLDGRTKGGFSINHGLLAFHIGREFNRPYRSIKIPAEIPYAPRQTFNPFGSSNPTKLANWTCQRCPSMSLFFPNEWQFSGLKHRLNCRNNTRPSSQSSVPRRTLTASRAQTTDAESWEKPQVYLSIG